MPIISTIPAVGLWLAVSMSLANALRDAFTKRALQRQDLMLTTFWLRVVIALGSFVAMPWLLMRHPLTGGAPGASLLSSALNPAFLGYFALDMVGVVSALLLFNRALQVSPLSLAVPFESFTLVFLIPTSWLVLHEPVTWPKIAGTLTMFVGSLVMYRKLFATSLLAPLRAIVTEPASRLTLLSVLLFSLTNPLDKKLVAMSSTSVFLVAYTVALAGVFALLTLHQRSHWMGVLRCCWRPLLLAGGLDLLTIYLQFAAYRYVGVVETLSIKRAGVFFSVLLGWFIFQEVEAFERLPAVVLMITGVIVICFARDATGAIEMGLAGLIISGLFALVAGFFHSGAPKPRRPKSYQY